MKHDEGYKISVHSPSYLAEINKCMDINNSLRERLNCSSILRLKSLNSDIAITLSCFFYKFKIINEQNTVFNSFQNISSYQRRDKYQSGCKLKLTMKYDVYPKHC